MLVTGPESCSSMALTETLGCFSSQAANDLHTGFQLCLLVRTAEAHPARKPSGRRLPRECLQSEAVVLHQTDGVNLQKALVINTQGTWQQQLPVCKHRLGLRWKQFHPTIFCWLLDAPSAVPYAFICLALPGHQGSPSTSTSSKRGTVWG